VLLDLVQLRLAQKDSAGAVRAAVEVLALSRVGEESRRKATLRLVHCSCNEKQKACWYQSLLSCLCAAEGRSVKERQGQVQIWCNLLRMLCAACFHIQLT
jgi:hypothetical protein